MTIFEVSAEARETASGETRQLRLGGKVAVRQEEAIEAMEAERLNQYRLPEG